MSGYQVVIEWREGERSRRIEQQADPAPVVGPAGDLTVRTDAGLTILAPGQWVAFDVSRCECEHLWRDETGLADAERVWVCSRCGYERREPLDA